MAHRSVMCAMSRLVTVLFVLLASHVPAAWGQTWDDLAGTQLRPLVGPGEYGSAVTTAWSGGAYDSRRDRILIFGGGHGDSCNNGVFAVYSDGRPSETIVAPSVCPPKPSDPMQAYPDGTPTSRHSYAGVAYITHLDAMWATGGSGYSGSGGGLSGNWLLWLGEKPPRWERLTAAPSPIVNAMIDYDPVSRLGYYVSKSGALWTFNFTSRTWTRVVSDQPAVAEPDPATMFRVDAQRHLAMVVGPRCRYLENPIGVYKGKPCTFIHVLDLDNPGAGAKKWDLTGDLDFLQVQGPGLAKHPTNGLWYGWAGQREVWTLDLDARKITKLATLTGSVPDGTRLAQGTYGRWAWSTAFASFVGVPHVDWPTVRYHSGNSSPSAHPSPSPSSFTLTLRKSGTGSGTVSGDGRYPLGAIVALTAMADANSVFAGWTAPCTQGSVTITGPVNCTATFRRTESTPTPTPTHTPTPTPTPHPTPGPTTTPAPNGFHIGDRVKVINTSALNVRSAPGLHTAVLGTQTTNARGTIVGGINTTVDGFHWWRINYDHGADGWSGGNYLQLTSDSTPTPAPDPSPSPSPSPTPSPSPSRSPSSPSVPPPPVTQDLTPNTWVATPQPPNQKWAVSGKHRRADCDPHTDICYITGGDHGIPPNASDAGNASVTKLDLATFQGEVISPMCLPAPALQPSFPDNVVWALDTKRQRGLLVRGFFFDVFRGINGCGRDGRVDLNMRRDDMVFDLASKKWLTKPWADAPREPGNDSNGPSWGVYDATTDCLYTYKWIGSGEIRSLCFDAQGRGTWRTFRMSGTRLESAYAVRSQIALDPGRALYFIALSRGAILVKIDLTSSSLAATQLPMPPGYVPAATDQENYMVFDPVNRVLLHPHVPSLAGILTALHIYDVEAGTWQTRPAPTGLPTPVMGNLAMYGSRCGCLVFYGGHSITRADGTTIHAKPIIWRYKYKKGG